MQQCPPSSMERFKIVGLEIKTIVAQPFILGLWFTTPNLFGRKEVQLKHALPKFIIDHFS